MIAGWEKGTFSNRGADLYSVDIYDIILEMNALIIDTHRAIRKLTANGYTQQQAETLVEVLSESELVTKDFFHLQMEKQLRTMVMWMVGLHIASLGVILTVINTAF